MKKTNIYRIEFQYLLLLALTVILTLITSFILFAIYQVLLNTFVVGDQTLNDLVYGLRSYFSFGTIKTIFEVIVFAIYFHIIFAKRIRYLLEISSSVKNMADGNFETRIRVNSEDILGTLAGDINNIMDKFNYALMEERNSEQTKIDLITSVSHDLRTPLTSILGYLQLVDDDKYDDELTLRYYVNIALGKTKQLKILIEDLFELTTLNNYGFKIERTELNLVELINQLVIEYKLILKNADIECRLDFPEEKVFISGDSSKLVRAFENLISNCIKYSKCSRFMDIAVHKGERDVCLEFINYGEPIPPSDIPYIFQRFYRVEKSRSRENGGSGLGLAISKNIIELHEGKISVESNIQRTIFRVKLPLSL